MSTLCKGNYFLYDVGVKFYKLVFQISIKCVLRVSVPSYDRETIIQRKHKLLNNLKNRILTLFTTLSSVIYLILSYPNSRSGWIRVYITVGMSKWPHLSIYSIFGVILVGVLGSKKLRN